MLGGGYKKWNCLGLCLRNLAGRIALLTNTSVATEGNIVSDLCTKYDAPEDISYNYLFFPPSCSCYKQPYLSLVN